MRPASGFEPTEVDVAETQAVQIDARSGARPELIGEAMSRAFEALGSFIGTHGVVCTGPPRAIYTNYDGNETSFTVAFPVQAGAAVTGEADGVRIGPLRGGPALRFTHIGPYDGLRETYGAIAGWLEDRGLLKSEADWANYMPMWEEYVGDPASTAPEKLVTYVYLPKRS